MGRSDQYDDDENSLEEERRGGRKRRSRDKGGTTDDEDDDDSSARNDRHHKRGHRRKGDRNHRKKKQKKESKKAKTKKHHKRRSRSRRDSSSSNTGSSSADDYSEDSSSESGDGRDESRRKKVVNERLLAKLQARGETLEERRERRAQKRAAHISNKFGYTPEDNPFHDPNIHETFVWKKRQEKVSRSETGKDGTGKKHEDTLHEIEKVRQRRKERELQFAEMERIRAEESRMKELEQYDDWAHKEEEFHLQQQRQRSAIRLVEGREKPIDVLAKNILLFGLSEEDKLNRATVKYKERFNALEALEHLKTELDEPQYLLKILKLNELQELLVDIDAFRVLERESCATTSHSPADVDNNPVLRYWDALYTVAQDEIKFLQTGGAAGSHAKVVDGVQAIFKDQTKSALIDMRRDVREKILQSSSTGVDVGDFDADYWRTVDEQLTVYLAKMELSEIHNEMLVRQLERLEKRKEELARTPSAKKPVAKDEGSTSVTIVPEVDGVSEEEFGAEQETEIDAKKKKYSWQDKYRPRKPRYFNRVKTGYDWNKYNQTHYDKDNPPPKVVQGYKFNIFYPDLNDPTKTPQFFLEPAATDEFCIIRFHAGPPYEDVAFKIINREWNKSRKQGYKCTFERGVLSLYFNFTTHWYRR